MGLKNKNVSSKLVGLFIFEKYLKQLRQLKKGMKCFVINRKIQGQIHKKYFALIVQMFLANY